MLRSFVIATLLLLSPPLLAQQEALNKTISVNFDNRPLEKVLESIHDKSGILLSYNPESVPLYQRVSYSADDKPVKSILQDILSPLDLEFQSVSK